MCENKEGYFGVRGASGFRATRIASTMHLSHIRVRLITKTKLDKEDAEMERREEQRLDS